jgi:hypothetical protein
MRRTSNASGGLRELLIAEADHRRERWARGPHWGWPEDTDWTLPMLDWEIDLRAGRAVLVSSTALLVALMHAGLPHDRFAYGGADWHKSFLLDERGGLTECAGNQRVTRAALKHSPPSAHN